MHDFGLQFTALVSLHIITNTCRKVRELSPVRKEETYAPYAPIPLAVRTPCLELAQCAQKCVDFSVKLRTVRFLLRAVNTEHLLGPTPKFHPSISNIFLSMKLPKARLRLFSSKPITDSASNV